MNRLSLLLRVYQRTRIHLLPLDSAADAGRIESLEATLRTLANRSFEGTGGLDERERDKIKSLLDDLIQCENPRKERLVKEACRLAYVAGFYARCAELFHSCHSLSPQTVSLTEMVINAAANTSNPEYLHKCLSCIPPINWEEPISVSALHALRIYWQSTKCYVRLERSAPLTANRDNSSSSNDNSNGSNSSSGGGGGVFLDKVDESARRSRLSRYRAVAAAAHERLAAPFPAAPFPAAWAQSRRLVAYHAADGGEAAVHAQFARAWRAAPALLAGLMRSCGASGGGGGLAEHYAQAAESSLLAGERGAPDDGLLRQYLVFMSVSMQSGRGVDMMRQLRTRRPDYVPSGGVVQAAARLAGKARNEDLAVWCLQALLNEKQTMPPSPEDIFFCLVSLAKCRAKKFYKLIHVLEESGLMKLTEEETFHLELQYNRHSLYWKEELGKRLEIHLSSVSANPDVAGLSVRNAAIVLRIMQENEHVTFMKYFRLYIKVYKCISIREKGRWLEMALKWAASQKELPREDYELIVNEVDIFLGLSASEPSCTETDLALAKRLRARLGNINRFAVSSSGENLSASLASKFNSSDHADVNLARFLKQRHSLPPPRQPAVKGYLHSLETKICTPSGALAILAEREWKALMQNID